LIIIDSFMVAHDTSASDAGCSQSVGVGGRPLLAGSSFVP
jgi:hypothetical protein